MNNNSVLVNKRIFFSRAKVGLVRVLCMKMQAIAESRGLQFLHEGNPCTTFLACLTLY